MNIIVKLVGTTLVLLSIFLVGCDEEKSSKDDVNVAAKTEAVSSEAATPAAETVAEDKPYMAATSEMSMVAEVSAINHETREVTLKGDDGSETSFIASEEVKNLPQVSVGDLVTVAYVESITIEVVDGTGLEAGTGAAADAVVAEEGQMPGMAASETSIDIFMVEEINVEANTFKLRDSDGVVREFVAQNPENLKRSAVGDAVIVTTSQSIAAEVVKMPTE